jgi:hypothetical protein
MRSHTIEVQMAPQMLQSLLSPTTQMRFTSKPGRIGFGNEECCSAVSVRRSGDGDCWCLVGSWSQSTPSTSLCSGARPSGSGLLAARQAAKICAGTRESGQHFDAARDAITLVAGFDSNLNRHGDAIGAQAMEFPGAAVEAMSGRAGRRRRTGSAPGSTSAMVVHKVG